MTDTSEILNALELTYLGHSEVVAYACPKCGAIYTPGMFGGGKYADAERAAREHCSSRHCDCGVELPKGRLFCRDCWSIDQVEKDREKFKVADKVSEKDYEHPIFWEGHEGSMGEGYFSTVDELRDYCAESVEKLPSYVWSCSPAEISINVDTILESTFENHCEGARDMLAEGAEDELKLLVRAWCERQNIRSWQVNYRQAVILDIPQETASLKLLA